MKFEQALKIAKEYLGEEYFKDLNFTFKNSLDLSLFKIKRNGVEVLVEYSHLSQVFRALTFIKEKHNESSFSIELMENFRTKGVMLDCSRNGVLRNEKVKEMILISALLGLNRLLLYTEDTFKLDKYPYFGYLRGAYSKEDIKEFVDYGESFGVELVPCIQTLGHLYQALKWAPMNELKDGDNTLMVNSPKVYEFIEEIIKFTRDCYKSKDIHIGMDESFEMGLQKYFKINGYTDRTKLFTDHLLKVKEICEKYNFSPMIWSDMYFRLNNVEEEYYGSSLPESTIELIPDGVKLVYWDYYHDKTKDYLDMIRYHKATNKPVVFAGGSWRWKGYTPSIYKSLEYSRCAFEACAKEKIDDIFITAWGDDGNECSFFSILPVLAEMSIINYGSFEKDKINSLLKAISNEELDDFLAMDLPDQILGKELTPYYNPSKYFLYQDLLLGIFDSQVKEGFAEKYAEFAVILQEKAKESSRYNYVYNTLANLCDVLSIKVDLGLKIRKAYKERNNDELKNCIVKIDELLIRLERFNKSVEEQWMRECKAFGYEVLDGRLGFLKNRVLSAKNRIYDYLGGRIKNIEELEEEILPFDGRNDELSWNWWLRNVSPSH